MKLRYKNISMIVAMDKTGSIGDGNDMPWGRDMPNDLRYFKNRTLGHTVVMGRKTYESIGRALPGRKNFVLTSNPEALSNDDSIIPISHHAEVLKYALRHPDEKIIIIGGASVYDLFADNVTTIYMTLVNAHYNSETKINIPLSGFNLEQGDMIHREGDLYPSQYNVYHWRD